MYIKMGIKLLFEDRSNLKKYANILSTNENCSIWVSGLKILHDTFVYGTIFSEYLAFDFFNRTSENKKTFVTTLWFLKMINTYNPVQYRNFFHDKIKFNNLFADYLGRDFLKIEDNEKDIERFINNHEKIVLKNSKGCSGTQVKVVSCNEINAESIVNNSEYDLMEECIYNHENISAFNASSLNTIRIVTVHSKEKFQVLFAALRVGAKGSTVDNVSQGGSSAAIDVNTGKIRSDFKYNIAKGKNNTQKMLGGGYKGFVIPYWKETLDMLERASKVVPQIHVVAWDVAITSDGPVIIEGNESFASAIMQYYAKINECGLKKEMEEALANI